MREERLMINVISIWPMTRCMAVIAGVVLSATLCSGYAFATSGDVFKKGTVYNAATYYSHPSKYGHKDDTDVVDINIGKGSADCNFQVLAPESGGVVTVMHRYRPGDGGWGNAIEWRKGKEKIFMAHLARFGKIGKADAGDVIGYIGKTGNADGCHLHIEAGGQLILSARRIIPSYQYNGYAYESKGPTDEVELDVFELWRKKDPIHASNRSGVKNFDAQFKVRNKSSRPKTIDDAAIAIVKDGSFLFDCWKLGRKATIQSGDVFHTGFQSCEIYEPGDYLVAARLKVDGRWREYERLTFKVYAHLNQAGVGESCDATKKTTADRVFSYVEEKYRSWFPPGALTHTYIVSAVPTYWRYYNRTNSYLWIWKDGHLWYKIGSGGWGKSSRVEDWCKVASQSR